MTSEIEAVRETLLAAGIKTSLADVAVSRALLDAMGDGTSLPEGWNVAALDLGRPVEKLSGPGGRDDRVLFYLHGGGYCVGSPRSHRGLAAQLALDAEASAVVLDYRLAPENPFPAAVDDAVEAYRRLLDGGAAAQSIVFIGDSAGGGLSVAAALKAKQLGLPQPLALVLLSPWADLSLTGTSMDTLAEQDAMLTRPMLDAFRAHYFGGAGEVGRLERDPLASPIYADLSGLPQTMIHVGDQEVLLDDAERLKTAMRKAGVDVTIEIWPEMIHVWHAFFPVLSDAKEAIFEIGAWLKRRWK